MPFLALFVLLHKRIFHLCFSEENMFQAGHLCSRIEDHIIIYHISSQSIFIPTSLISYVSETRKCQMDQEKNSAFVGMILKKTLTLHLNHLEKTKTFSMLLLHVGTVRYKHINLFLVLAVLFSTQF